MLSANAWDEHLTLDAEGDWASGFRVRVQASRALWVEALVMLTGTQAAEQVLDQDFDLGVGEWRSVRWAAETATIAFQVRYVCDGRPGRLRVEFSR